jgi:hypothetical protein
MLIQLTAATLLDYAATNDHSTPGYVNSLKRYNPANGKPPGKHRNIIEYYFL